MADLKQGLIAGVVALAIGGGVLLGRTTAPTAADPTPAGRSIPTAQPAPVVSNRVCQRVCKPLLSEPDPFAPGRCVTICPDFK